MQPQPMPDPDKFAIGAIFKNERPYILEWIAFHRSIGIKKFFIADNDSTDGSKDLLRLLDLAGIIHYFDFPSESGVKPQQPAYSKILNIARKSGIEWVAFIDADEFLMPEAENMDFFSCIEKSVSQEDTGAVAINWAIYGSSGLEERPDGLVLKEFSKRAPLDLHINLHYKSLVKLKAVSGVSGTPHHFFLNEGFQYKNIQGSILENDLQDGIGKSHSIAISPIRINHYIVKSKNEFFNKKSPKGYASSQATAKGKIYFEHHDRNDENDPCSPKRIEQTIVEMEDISKQLALVRNVQSHLRNRIIRENCKALKSIVEKYSPHSENLPSDFVPLHYLLLNPDVLIAGADPVQHYLTHGAKEGRAYRIPSA
jgi:hypothetical protein